MVNFVAFVIWAALLVPLLALEGFVLTRLWEWFVTPLWPSAPALGLWHAVGLALIVSLLTHQRSAFKEEPYETFVNSVTHSVSVSLFAWLIGWSIWGMM